jgi:hypothetical protein
MFRYQDTGKLSQPQESQRMVVTEVRQVTYLHNNPNPKISEPITSEGFETVTEMVVSQGYVCVPKVVGHKTVDGRRDSQIKRPKEEE